MSEARDPAPTPPAGSFSDRQDRGHARWFAHVDMDAFYASVEVLDQPRLAGLPVAVGGEADRRGVIAAASYAARRFGVRSAMPTATAQRLCPGLVLLPGRMERYRQKSAEVMAILREVAPAVEPLSLDEAALELTGCARVHGVRDGDWTSFALDLRRRIRRETGLWASVGMGETRRIAKIASDLRKPRGLTVVERGAGPAFLAHLPLERLWGVGPRLRERLRALGYGSSAALARASRSELGARLGRAGLSIHDLLHARETGSVDPDRTHRSIRHETTFATDRIGLDALEPVLRRLGDKVGRRLRQRGLQGRVVQLKIRDRGFHTFTRQHSLARPTDSDAVLYATGRRLLRALGWEEVPVRLIGIGVGELVAATAAQGELFPRAVEEEREASLDRLLDRVRSRFGESALEHGRSLLAGDVSGTPWAGTGDGPDSSDSLPRRSC